MGLANQKGRKIGYANTKGKFNGKLAKPLRDRTTKAEAC